jgi:WD40 repeat protein
VAATVEIYGAARRHCLRRNDNHIHPDKLGVKMRAASLFFLVATAAAGCKSSRGPMGDGGPEVGITPPTDGQVTEATSGSGGAGGDDGGSQAVLTPFPDAGTLPAAAACGLRLALTDRLSVAPAAPGQSYVRCGSIGSGSSGWHVVMAPDGAHVAARTSIGTVRLISVADWHELAQLASPVGRMDAAAFSPDGAHLAVLSNEAGEVTLWSTRDGTLERTFAGPPGPTVDLAASALAFSSDGQRLATSLGTVIDLAKGTSRPFPLGGSSVPQPPPYALAANPARLSDGASFTMLRFAAGGGLLFWDQRYAIGNSPATAQLASWDVTTGATQVMFQAYDRALHGYALSPDGTLLALSVDPAEGGRPAGLHLLRTATGAEVTAAADFTATPLAFTPDGGHVLSDGGGVIEVRDTARLAVTARYALPANAKFVGMSPDGALVVADAASTWWLDAASGATVKRQPFALREISWSAGPAAVGTGADGALLHAWRSGADQCVPATPEAVPSLASAGFATVPALTSPGRRIDTGNMTIYTVATSPDGNTVAGNGVMAGGQERFGAWRASDGTALWTTSDSDGLTQGAGFSTDGSVLAAALHALHTHARDFFSFHVWDAASGTLLRVFGADAGTLAVTPDGARLATPERGGFAVWCR